MTRDRSGRSRLGVRHLNGLAIQNFEAPFQILDVKLALVLGLASSGLKAQPETADPTHTNKQENEVAHAGVHAPGPAPESTAKLSDGRQAPKRNATILALSGSPAVVIGAAGTLRFII